MAETESAGVAGERTLNGGPGAKLVVDTARLSWSASPSPTVFRKRLHHAGPPESGQVTSLVRFEPGASFPLHPHPDGEEILVLDGVFSDERGDWPAGSYLLNPEGFVHEPRSAGGCLLFVRLRQHAGRDRAPVAVAVNAVAPEPVPGVGWRRRLCAEPGYADATFVETWPAGAEPDPRTYAGGAELFVLAGVFEDESGRHGEGTWLRLPPGTTHRYRPRGDCTVYLRTGGFACIDEAGENSTA
jgi:anti-sigma factor ChrR (cupin superfamily)